MKTILPGELKSLMATHPDLALVDVRTPLEFVEMHVAGSKNIPLDELSLEALLHKGLPPAGTPLYLICRSGQRSTRAAEKLQQTGVASSIIVEGGTLAWIEAGLPVKRSARKVISLERQVRIVAGSLVFIGVLLGWWVHPGFFGLSGFVGAGLVFAGITDFCGMGLLLAKAPWNKKVSV